MQILKAILLTVFLLSTYSYSPAITPEDPQIKDSSLPIHNNDSPVALQLGAGQPGGVIGILSEGRAVIKRSYGSMDLEQDRENDANTIFDIASVAKQFTAYAILLLEKEGKLDPDDNVHKWLPELTVYEHQITIRHLLQHTSGIASTDVLRLFAGLSLDEPWNQQDEFEMIRHFSADMKVVTRWLTAWN